jgi:hypothetical protein
VESNAAMRLTTSTFDVMKSDTSLGRAEALRRAMLTYLNDPSIAAFPAVRSGLWASNAIPSNEAARVHFASWRRVCRLAAAAKRAANIKGFAHRIS